MFVDIKHGYVDPCLPLTTCMASLIIGRFFSNDADSACTCVKSGLFFQNPTVANPWKLGSHKSPTKKTAKPMSCCADCEYIDIVPLQVLDYQQVKTS